MDKPNFKVFLSHRYKSAEVNLRFFEILSAHGNLRFDIDAGVKATNVTRLEMMVRDADAFVGIYPFPSDLGDRPGKEAALKESRYFRLELDLALRSRRPTMLFVDSRYGTAITVPDSTQVYRYDHRDIQGVTSDRRGTQLAQLAAEFCEEVAAGMRLKGGRDTFERDVVGLMLPVGAGAPRYSNEQIEKMEERLSAMSLSPVRLDWDAAVNGAFLRQLERLDWAIVDIGAESCAGGLPPFLHGYFLPQMRLMHCDGDNCRSPIEGTLLSGFEVGYPKDIVRWSDGESLDSQFVQRLSTLYEPRDSMATVEQAISYFSRAALRKEAVFLSYSGEDRDFVANLAASLKSRFQQVFDYRDQGESIVPGRRWIEEIFEKLSASAIGIPVLSESYLASGNCTHEARQMMALADQGKMKIFPVKMKEGTLQLPAFMQDLQYIRGWEYRGADLIVDKVVSCYESSVPPP